MRLKKVVFYQAVKLWDANSVLTVNEGENKKLQGVTITIENHMITLECPEYAEIIVVGTSNMREARYWREPYGDFEKRNPGTLDPNPEGLTAPNFGPHPESKGLSGLNEPATERGVVKDSPVPAGFDPSKYAGKPKEEKVTKPKAQKAVK